MIGNTAALANGVFAQVNGGTGTAGVLFDGTLNFITLGTFGDDAVYLQNNTTGLSFVTIAAGTRLDLANGGTSGTERDGIDITATGGGNGSVVHRGSGTITTGNGNGIFVKTQGGGSANVEVSSGVAISVSKPAAGGNYAGIHTRVADTGATSITSGASLQISGANAYGIYTQAVDGATGITNSGTIVTDGLNGFGIRAATTGLGGITIDNSGAITTTGQGGHGIYVTSPGGVVSVRNDGALTVGSAGAAVGSRAMYINPTGDIDISGSGDILVLGNAATAGGYGIIANSTVGHIFLDYSGDVTVSGNGAGAIRLDSISGNVDVDYSGDRIETFNQNGIGIYASSRSATGTVDVDAGGTIVTHADNGGGDGSGTGAFGIEAISYGGDITISYDGPLIDVNGTGAGILAGNAYFTGTGLGMIDVESSGDIVARGNQQQGIRAFSTTGAQTITNSGAISTLGTADSQGILALTNGAAPLLVVNEGGIRTIGTGSSAIDAVSPGGSASVRNEGLIAAGWGTSAGVLIGGTTQTITNAGSVGALSDAAIRADGGGFAGTLDIVNQGTLTGVVTASTSAVDFDNSGLWNLRSFADTTGSGTRGTLSVAISSLGTSGSNVIGNSGVLALLGDEGGATSIDTTGAYQPLGLTSTTMAIGGPVQGQILGVSSFMNSGLIDLTANGAAGDVLLVSGGLVAGVEGGGEYVANGGMIRFDTVLDEGGPGSTTDVVVFDSTRFGAAATVLDVRNTGGAGAPTIGNGIPLVEVLNKAASAADVFVLQGDYLDLAGRPAIVGGAYSYTLFQNGIGADSADGNWYLRSETLAGDPDDPDFQPGVPIYEAYPQHLLALMRLPTMQQRVGNRYWGVVDENEGEASCGAPTTTYNCPVIEGQGVWTRIEGLHSRVDPSSSTSATRYDVDLWKLQAGVDGLLHEADDGSLLIGGLNLQYGRAWSDVSSVFGRGGIGTTGYGLGATLTWLDENGFYVDGQATATWFDSDLSSRTAGSTLADGSRGFGYALSVETGKKIALDDEWTTTPQFQLMYSHVRFDAFDDEFGARVSSDRGESLIGRLGITADRERNWLDDDGKLRRTHLYGIANLYYEFLDGAEVNVAGVGFASRNDRLWGGIGLGGSYNWDDDKYSVYGEVSANTSLESFGDSYSIQGTVGLRIRW